MGCHMAPLKTADDDGEGGPMIRSHTLQTPRDPSFLRQAFGLSAHRRGELTVLRVENRCGHRVPGLAEREIEFVIEGLDADRDERAEPSFIISKGLIRSGLAEGLASPISMLCMVLSLRKSCNRNRRAPCPLAISRFSSSGSNRSMPAMISVSIPMGSGTRMVPLCAISDKPADSASNIDTAEA